MNISRTVRATRTRLAATAAALAGFAFGVTSCGGDAAPASDKRGDSIDGVYIGTSGKNNRLVTIENGNKITFFTLYAGPKNMCALLTKTFADIDSGKLAPGGKAGQDRYDLESGGTISENRTTVVWDNAGGADDPGTTTATAPIKVESDMITVKDIFDNPAEDEVLVPRGSDHGKAILAKRCG
ncbi:hypothetical protein [Amycolatopsis sp. CA-230715]|uniref:hypothetical protein n=1 Tax=Amycolatopsis sp. CA-230715 TaxID=2745196 RepID=UPI001C034EAA|nr:hypothetical protein [Amycolatopsis sp. CA-230715]QWF85924.1 hypothetical protein HUW46_09404 [Amycolatopsis sp. CA-230715]